MPAQAIRTLALAAIKPLAAGHLRYVYQHPDDAGYLVKVMRPDMLEKRWGGRARWHKRLPRTLQYAGFLREIKETIALRVRKPDGALPIARSLGIVETDLGLGLVVERICDRDGALAPTLAALVQRDGYTPSLREAVEHLITDLLAHHVIVGDMHPGNIALGTDSDGQERLVLIDGFGEKNVIPACSMSRAFNRWNTRRRADKLRRKISRIVPTPTL